MTREELLHQIGEKYQNMGENADTYLTGLLHAKPITYWDYVQVDTLLTLQKPRTDFKDESIFIMYHQVTELVLKMMVHEAKQLVFDDLTEAVWLDKIERLNRYTSMLITSFDVMKYGMNYDDYNQFRSTLAPASGFQSAQFRYLELLCTRPQNLINEAGQSRLPENPTVADYFEHIYWKDAGHNRETGKKSLTLRQFEDKYLKDFTNLTNEVQGRTIEERAQILFGPESPVHEKLRGFDHLYNVAWPKVHLDTAQHYLNRKGENKAATGGSAWQKYLHPKYQQRKFFPELWTESEIAQWGA